MSIQRPKPRAARSPTELNNVLQDLNQRYRLGISIADPKLSPRKRRQQLSQSSQQDQCAEKIKARLRYFFYQDPVVLDGVLDRFHLSAINICRGWEPRPGAGRDTLPASQGSCPPQIISETERYELQTRLHDILEDAWACRKSHDRSFEGITHDSVPTASQRAFKRTSGELTPEPLSKRTRNTRSWERSADELDRMPDRTRSCASPVATAKDSIPDHMPRDSAHAVYDKSANTSNTTLLSNDFSQFPQEDVLTQNTQTTVEADSQERRRDDVSTAPNTPSREYDASSQMIQILEESFSRHENNFENPDETPLNPYVEEGGPANLSSLSAKAETHDPEIASTEKLTTLKERLKTVWPRLPGFLNLAPLAVCWEVIRIATHCGVKLDELEGLCYSDDWLDQTQLRGALRQRRPFQGKRLPELCSETTWAASIGRFEAQGSRTVSLVIDLSWNTEATGPLFKFSLQPLKLELGHRLSRRFGSDRFLEFNLPPPASMDVPPEVKKLDGAMNEIILWLTTEKHFIAGRQWAAFFTRSTEKLVAEPRKGPLGRDGKETATIKVRQCRVYCFAEDGHSFSPGNGIPNKAEAGQVNERTNMKLSEMLEWSIAISKNMSQPCLKLFSRLALSLSRTHPTIVFEPRQIQHEQWDLLSPSGKVMNDGVAQMSSRAARLIRDALGLTDTPSAYQGRFGSAKGVWVVATESPDDEVWITTYPSQRKWECDFLDEDHRMFEVKTEARPLKVASLNMQFIPVLENQALNRREMRMALKTCLEKTLEEELARQRSSMEDSAQFRQWIHESFFQGYRIDRLRCDHVPFRAGLPDSEAERVNMLLDAGFHPKKLRYLRDLSYRMAFRKCELLKSKMNIKIGRSAYAYMVVDFAGVLEEGQVHLGFSSKFQDLDGEFSDTLLHGMDVLVARAPAHLPSDIQRVRAVFRPELRHLKDVIVFSRNGDGPLADLLSGGDYDGDQAWVCWDPNIVNNFRNAEYPPGPDFFELGYLQQRKGTFQDLVLKRGNHMERAVADFMYDSFNFNMQDQLLGICTIYKERLCYKYGSVQTDAAISLSRLLGHLVDQPKQGIVFGWDQWTRFRKDHLREKSQYLEEPRYKSTVVGVNDNDKRSSTEHVLDYLRFAVAVPLIDKELRAFSEMLGSEAEYWDKDLAGPFYELDEITRTLKSSTFDEASKEVKRHLTSQLESVRSQWTKVASAEGGYAEMVQAIYDQWMAIGIPAEALKSNEMKLYLGNGLPSPLLDKWALLKASATFKQYHGYADSFVWTIAGRQLAYIKAFWGREGLSGPVPVVPAMYATLRPDSGLVKGRLAKNRSADGQSVVINDVEFDEEGTQMDDA